MLRNLLPKQPLLLQLINNKEWELVKLRLQTHPGDAVPNQSANRGIGSTALTAAVRGGAKLDTIVALTEASIDQLVRVRHYRRGTVLHEAIIHRLPIDIIAYFIHTIIEYEQRQQQHCVHKSGGDGLRPITVKNSAGVAGVGNTEKRRQSSPTMTPSKIHTQSTIFNQNDDRGRTPLHYLVERAAESQARDARDNIMHTVQMLAQVFPPAVGKQDTDENTPLDLALISQRESGLLGSSEMEFEMKVFGLCTMLIKTYPMAAYLSVHPAIADVAILSTALSRGSMSAITGSTTARHRFTRDTNGSMETGRHTGFTITKSNLISGNIKPNPLSHGLMHGRHISTIEMLIEASKQPQTSWYTGLIDDASDGIHETDPSSSLLSSQLPSRNKNDRYNSCMRIVTRDMEVPLHIAVTMRASLDVVRRVLTSGPDAAAVPDRCNLTPVCWTWMRFVIDTYGSHQSLIKASKRRFIPRTFLESAGAYTQFLSMRAKDICHPSATANSNAPMDRACVGDEDDDRDFWLKLSTLLPHAAESLAKKCPELNILSPPVTPWTALHAAAYLSCPRSIVLKAICEEPWRLREKDDSGNLPLHLAAGREAYCRFIPLGVPSESEEITEPSVIFDLVSLFPNSTRVKNTRKQLPLHIAIEMEKRARSILKEEYIYLGGRSNHDSASTKEKDKLAETMEKSPVLYLSKADPETLQCRDGLTKLYPFMQAAVGAGSSLDIVYLLLRECPTLLE